MTTSILIGLVGDYDANVLAHEAIPRALALAAAAIGRPIVAEWVPTPEICDESRVAAFDGIWCVPASPYRSLEGALCAIRFAREKSRPFLGTCGGFQHAIVEYARAVLGWSDAEHAETAPVLVGGPLRVSAEDNAGEVRAVELDEHPFFVATLFQPERAALTDRLPPLVHAFVQSAVLCESGILARVT